MLFIRKYKNSVVSTTTGKKSYSVSTAAVDRLVSFFFMYKCNVGETGATRRKPVRTQGVEKLCTAKTEAGDPTLTIAEAAGRRASIWPRCFPQQQFWLVMSKHPPWESSINGIHLTERSSLVRDHSHPPPSSDLQPVRWNGRCDGLWTCCLQDECCMLWNAKMSMGNWSNPEETRSNPMRTA